MSRVAAVPLAARLDERIFKGASAPRVVVIGAGAFGGWTAHHLQRLGAHVTLVDAWGAGNTRSSSGGQTRVIRAIYGPDRIYVQMVRRSFELWEELDRQQEEKIYTETGTLWMIRGDDAYVRTSMPVLRDFGFPVESLTIAEAKKRYPQIRFDGVRSVYLETRSGALRARDGCVAVRDRFEASGGDFVTAHVDTPRGESDRIGAVTANGRKIEADAFVFACGPWLSSILPEAVGDRVRATKQEVLYFGTPAGSQQYAPPQMPTWIDFGERIFYGIPDLHERGFKIADDTRGKTFDPTLGSRTVAEESVVRARALLRERFPLLAAAPLIASEVCQYENSPDGHLIVDRHSRWKNVIIAGGGSGHGYKLGPAVGELAALAILTGSETPEMFRLSRLEKPKPPSTQFENR
jgi:sarcosine oxidase